MLDELLTGVQPHTPSEPVADGNRRHILASVEAAEAALPRGHNSPPQPPSHLSPSFCRFLDVVVVPALLDRLRD
jgi:hypothetical protein